MKIFLQTEKEARVWQDLRKASCNLLFFFSESWDGKSSDFGKRTYKMAFGQTWPRMRQNKIIIMMNIYVALCQWFAQSALQKWKRNRHKLATRQAGLAYHLYSQAKVLDIYNYRRQNCFLNNSCVLKWPFICLVNPHYAIFTRQDSRSSDFSGLDLLRAKVLCEINADQVQLGFVLIEDQDFFSLDT